MLKSITASATILTVLMSSSLYAEAEKPIPGGEETSMAPMAETSAEEIVLLPSMDFRRWPDDAFFEAKMSLTDALSSAHADERGAVMLDLAELHLGQMLTVEAQSFVEAAKSSGWMETDRYTALHDAVKLLMSDPVENIETSPLVTEDRPDRSLWLSLNGIATGDPIVLSQNLQGALVGLSYQNGPVARTLLPLVAEAAVNLKDTPVSEAALAVMATVPAIADSPTGQYLLGRHQANIGNEKSALEAFFEASQGWDRYAARARIAIADLALKEASAGALLAARDVLAVGSGAWRGDAFEVATLERTAEVNGMLGEHVTALLAYRRILTRYPDSPSAETALLKAGTHLETVYRQGANGEIDLAEWFELHQILLPTYRYLPQFPRFNEMLADAVFEMGGTYLASAEYRQTLGIYENWDLTLGREAPAEDVDRVRYKLAKSLKRAQDWRGTLDVLDEVDLTSDAEMRDRVNKMRVKALKELGDNDKLLRTFVSEPDSESLRSWSQALFVQQDWEGAKAQYMRLLETYPDEFQIRDASYLLIIAHRTEDDELGRKVAMSFPQLTESEGISSLANRFLQEPTPLLPLRDQMTSDRLQSASDVMTILESSGF